MSNPILNREVSPGRADTIESEAEFVQCGFWLACNAQCVNPRLNPSHLHCLINNKCVSKINLEGGGYFLLFDPLECDRCKAFLEGDVSAEPLNSLFQWVEEMKASGVTVTWKDTGLQNFVRLNISAHNFDKSAVVALQVFLLRQSETVSVPAETVALVFSPFYQAISMFRQMGYIIVNGVSVS